MFTRNHDWKWNEIISAAESSEIISKQDNIQANSESVQCCLYLSSFLKYLLKYLSAILITLIEIGHFIILFHI